MKKNKKTFVFALLLLAIAAVSQLNISDKRELLIEAPLFDVAPQFTDLRNWKN